MQQIAGGLVPLLVCVIIASGIQNRERHFFMCTFQIDRLLFP